MFRVLRAFAWMRWRVLVNSFERTGARDTLERFSVAIEQVTPILALIVFVPSMLGTAALGAAAGYTLAGGDSRTLLLDVARYLLLAALLMSVVGPVMMPAADRTNHVRVLLLPIARPTLYVAQIAGALSDPWLLVTIPFLLLVPVGLAAGGALAGAAAALAAGLLFLAILVGVTSLLTSLLHMLARNRRRGELLALLFVLVLPLVGMIPALMNVERNDGEERRARTRREPSVVARAASRAAPYVPSELYLRALRHSVTALPAASIAALAATAAVLHVAGFVLYGRLLDSPGESGASRRAVRRKWAVAIPFVSPGVSAVALAELRLVARTPRGRSLLLSPLIIVVMFGVMMYRASSGMQVGFVMLQNGAALAAFGAVGTLLSVLPIAMNQFAVDGAGLTLTLLSPLSERDILTGKAIGGGLIVAGPAMLCLAVALVAFPTGSPWLWLSIPLALAATYVLVTPVAAALSAIFPRATDLNSIGRGSNAHGAASFLGFAAFLAAAAPCALLVLLATRILHRPILAPLFLLVWLVFTMAIAAALFVPVRKLFAQRRENLGMVV